jgi:CRP-like cAMP-binding protein
MDILEKKLKTRLTSQQYQNLKEKCVSESISIEDYLAKLVSQDVTRSPLPENFGDDEKDIKTEIINLFNECKILDGANPSDLEKLVEVAEYVHLPKRKIICHVEDVCRFFYIIANGLMKVYKISPSGREFAIDILSRGETFGGGRIINGSLHFAEAITIEDTEMVLIPKNRFLEFSSLNPQVITNISILENNRFVDMFNKLMSILTDTAYQRVVQTLTALMHKYGDTLHFNHKIIAELSGTTSETVARAMTHLKHCGAIRLNYGSVQIIDPIKLSRDTIKVNKNTKIAGSQR